MKYEYQIDTLVRKALSANADGQRLTAPTVHLTHGLRHEVEKVDISVYMNCFEISLHTGTLCTVRTCSSFSMEILESQNVFPLLTDDNISLKISSRA